MKAISIIGGNTFKEAVRDRVFLGLLLFAVFVSGITLLAGQMSFGIDSGVLINSSLLAMTLIGVGVAVFFGAQLVLKEIERRTIYTLLAHPVARSEFVLGKYVGLLLTLGLNCFFMALLLWAALSLQIRGFHPGEWVVLTAIYFLFLELSLLTAWTLLFSSFATPVMAVVFSLAIFAVGSFTEDLRALARAGHAGLPRTLALATCYLLPDFSVFNISSRAAHFITVPARMIWLNSAYALLYSGFLLLMTIVVLEHREF